MDEEEVPTAPVWVWIGLTVISAISFWAQATVTEERFVPALNLLSNEFNIPDDVAGATLMAAGASSPELFSSIVALFITHSSLGLGTIVGSEIFNQLIICAGAVFASKSGHLQLDKAIVTREVSFYALSIVLLYLALQDVRPVDDDVEDHIFISFPEACMVFAGYIAYVLVCANMSTVVAFFQKTASSGLTSSTKSSGQGYGTINYITKISMHVERMPFLQEMEAVNTEPADNFKSVKLYRSESGSKRDITAGPGNLSKQQSSGMDGEAGSFKRHQNMGKSFGDTLRNMAAFEFLMHHEKPSDDHGLYDVEVNKFQERLSCFMWQRSYFYNKARVTTRAWHLRWFTLTDTKMYSVPDRINFAKHKMSYPKFEEVHVDPKRLFIKVMHPDGDASRDFLLHCPSIDIFEQVVEKMGNMIEKNLEDKEDDGGNGMDTPAVSDDRGQEYDQHMVESLTEFPADGSAVEIFFFCVLFPFRILMEWTVPDVRTVDRHGNPMSTLPMAWLAILMCLVWLIVGSYAMVASLESLAALMNIPDAVVGVTVSAAGTSLPNYVASKVAAENGFGNMAVSNAFGSNTFNIMIGLGVPWVLYTSFGTGFEPYNGLRNEGIVESVVIMGSVCALFIVFMIPSGFVLYKWHGVVFILLYIAYLAFAIGQVYL